MAFTLDQLCSRVSALTGLTDATGDPERTLLEEWANEGISKVFQDTQCVITNVTVELTADEDEYALDRGVLTVLNYAQISDSPSVKVSVMNAADILERRFLASAGENIRYFAVLGGNILIVSPKPSVATSITFYAVPVPTVMTASDDIFDTGLPTYGQRAVECYMNARGFEHARDYRNSAYWMSNDEMRPGQYERECAKIKVTMRRQAGRTLPASRIGYPDRIGTPSRNDVYPIV